jgi:hypothetical protein
MRIVCALDVHRSQITYLTLDIGSGEVSRGRISPATRRSVRAWLAQFDRVDDARFALEGTTGWRFVVEEVEWAGHRGTWPTRPRRRPSGGANDAPRPTAPIASCCCGGCWRASCRSRGSRRRRSWAAYPCALAQDADRRAHRLAAAAAGTAVPPGCAGGAGPRTRAGREALARVELSPAGRELRPRSSPNWAMRAASAAPTTPSATAASTSPCTSRTTSARPATSRTKAQSCCAGRCSKRPSRRVAPPHPTTSTTVKSRSGSSTTAPVCRSRASSAAAPTTSCANSATRRSHRSSPRRLARR